MTFKAMLFIPSRAPYDYYTKDYKKGLQLYSSGVLIMENCADLLPEHFRFVRGIVDSQDLSLNISREMLQHDRQLKIIASNLEKKIKAELVRMEKDEREKYEKFYAAFGRQLKYGVVSDYGTHKDFLQELLLFWSSKENKLVTLQEYVDAMGADQKYIYYAAGESRDRLAQLPQTELVKDKGYDILFFTEDVDEFIPQTLMKVGEKEFRNIASEDLGLQSDEEKKETQEAEEKAKDVLDFVKETLGEKVKEVRVSKTLKSPPRVPGARRGHELRDGEVHEAGEPRLRLRGRPHPGAQHRPSRLCRPEGRHANDKEKAEKYVKILFAQALLMADLPLDNPTEYTDLVCSLMQ